VFKNPIRNAISKSACSFARCTGQFDDPRRQF
jgi:hypothetical protein